MPSGGAHGGGRPTNMNRTSKEHTKFALRMKEVVNVTLEEVTPQWRDIVKKSIELALQGNVALLKMLIELPFKSLDFSETPDGPLDYLREHMQKAGLVELGSKPQDPD